MKIASFMVHKNHIFVRKIHVQSFKKISSIKLTTCLLLTMEPGHFSNSQLNSTSLTSFGTHIGEWSSLALFQMVFWSVFIQQKKYID